MAIIHIWSTKYALSNGLLEHEVEFDESRPDYVWTGPPGQMGSYPLAGCGVQWHRTKESAIRKSNELRTAKIASLKKQIAKLENLTFE